MTKRFFLLAMAVCVTLTLPAKDILVNTPNTSLLLKAEEGQPLHISYYGERIDDISQVYHAYSLWKHAYPAFAGGGSNSYALSVKHADGNMSTELVYLKDTQTTEPNATLYIISMKDKAYDLMVDVCYRAYNNSDVIETWAVINNQEKKSITLQKYASGFLPLRRGNAWVSHQHGAWGAEAYVYEEPLQNGLFEVCEANCARNAFDNRANIMISLDGKPRENEGRVVGAVLCWSGPYRFSIDTSNQHEHYLTVGINEANSAYALKKGDSFITPVLALSYSTEGKGGVSRSYHRWARLNNKVHNGTALRKILLNSWEGVYLNVSHDGMEQMMDGIQELGGELFVMDDGWFGNKYRRTKDNCALGDWVTDTVKLPRGIPALEQAATKRGLKWGIWIEPEMTNTKSELYENHPDWVVCHPNRTPVPGRGGTQLILDMSNPKVQDFVFDVVDRLMKETPNTYYMKWDANFDIANFGSHYLTADNQSHLYVDYHRGLQRTLERIRERYPNLILQCCSSGGGRVNYGLMPYFDEFWVSDNTDAVQRLFIQWGTSMFFPACAMAQHVSASPNHQTGRVIPLKFRFDVAMTGRLGMEMKPSDLTERELAYAKNAVATYKEIRPIIQQGNQYRILSPYDKTGYASELFITDDKSEAVFFAYRFENYLDMFRPRFHFAGLDPNATYRLTELCRNGNPDHWESHTFTGKFLMQQGVEIALRGQFASKIIRLTRL